MDFQPPYFPPPFPGGQAGNPADVFSQHLTSDPYQHYAVSSPLFRQITPEEHWFGLGTSGVLTSSTAEPPGQPAEQWVQPGV